MKSNYAAMAILLALTIGFVVGQGTQKTKRTESTGPVPGNILTLTRPDETSPSGWSSTRIGVGSAKKIGTADWVIVSADISK